MIECASTGSRLATGSSARIISGPCISARATADPLLLATAECVRPVVGLVREADSIELFVGPVDLALREPVDEAQRRVDVSESSLRGRW